MKKIVLTFPHITSRKEIHTYLKKRLELPEYYGNNLDALYDVLTDISEPTAVGIFLPVSDNDELDIELYLYLEKVRKVFLRAERDNSEYLAVFSDDDVWKETEVSDPEENPEDDDSDEDISVDGEESMDPEEDPDLILARFFESLDPENRKK